MRLNQFLAHAGLGSRRSVEALINSGRVTINGVVATLHAQVTPRESDVRLDGKALRLPDQFTYLMLHKPPGYTVTREDPHAGRDVYELLSAKYQPLAYVGRLDRESEGLLLFTDDGVLCHRLLLPSYRIEREYLVTVTGVWNRGLEGRLVEGVKFPDGPPLAAARVRTMTERGDGAELCIVLTEGKKREVRKLCAHVGLKVQRLCRVRFGPVELGELPSGQFRALAEAEVEGLRRLVHLARN